MNTYAPIVDNPICINCKKQISETIYVHEQETYLCEKCLKKFKWIDNKLLKLKVDTAKKNILDNLNNFIQKNNKEKRRLVELKQKFVFNDFNENLLKDELIKIGKFEEVVWKNYKEQIEE